MNANDITAADLARNAYDTLLRRAEYRLKDAIEAGEECFWLDAFGRLQDRALPAVGDVYKARGFRVRRRYMPLRWIMDGILVAWG